MATLQVSALLRVRTPSWFNPSQRLEPRSHSLPPLPVSPTRRVGRRGGKKEGEGRRKKPTRGLRERQFNRKKSNRKGKIRIIITIMIMPLSPPSELAPSRAVIAGSCPPQLTPVCIPSVMSMVWTSAVPLLCLCCYGKLEKVLEKCKHHLATTEINGYY